MTVYLRQSYYSLKKTAEKDWRNMEITDVQEMHMLRQSFGPTWRTDKTIDRTILDHFGEVARDDDGWIYRDRTEGLRLIGKFLIEGLISPVGTKTVTVEDAFRANFGEPNEMGNIPMLFEYKNQREVRVSTYAMTDKGAEVSGVRFFNELPKMIHEFPETWNIDEEFAESDSAAIWQLAFNTFGVNEETKTQYRTLPIGSVMSQLMTDAYSRKMFCDLPHYLTLDRFDTYIDPGAYTTSAVTIHALFEYHDDYFDGWLYLRTYPDVTGFDATVEAPGVIMTLCEDRDHLIRCEMGESRDRLGL